MPLKLSLYVHTMYSTVQYNTSRSSAVSGSTPDSAKPLFAARTTSTLALTYRLSLYIIGRTLTWLRLGLGPYQQAKLGNASQPSRRGMRAGGRAFLLETNNNLNMVGEAWGFEGCCEDDNVNRERGSDCGDGIYSYVAQTRLLFRLRRTACIMYHFIDIVSNNIYGDNLMQCSSYHSFHRVGGSLTPAPTTLASPVCFSPGSFKSPILPRRSLPRLFSSLSLSSSPHRS